MHDRNTPGFTIVELLIVIVIVGILVTITIVTFSGVKQRAQAASISDGLHKIDTAMRYWVTVNGSSSWPIDPIVNGGTPLTQMVADNPTLAESLQQVPQVAGLNLEDWFYDNEGDERTSCTDPYRGVNIVIRILGDATIAAMVDKTLDDDDINCGKVRYMDGRLFYSLSYVQAINN